MCVAHLDLNAELARHLLRATRHADRRLPRQIADDDLDHLRDGRLRLTHIEPFASPTLQQSLAYQQLCGPANRNPRQMMPPRQVVLGGDKRTGRVLALFHRLPQLLRKLRIRWYTGMFTGIQYGAD